VVGSARVRWYRLVSDRRTRIVTLSGAALGRMPFPAQLTLRDPDGGLLGFPGSHGAGGRRVAVRVEERVLLGTLRSRADVAIALFGDAGRLWAGDVPYGAPTPIRSSAGLSLMAAYPSGGKRIFRLDIGVPLNPERGGSGFAIRVSVADRTSRTWTESREVARARSGPGPATFARW
jgi:hypothetical protein